MELRSMVTIDFTYNGVDYIGYESRSLYFEYGTPYIVQFWLYKALDDVDTVFLNVSTSETEINTIINLGVDIILGQ